MSKCMTADINKVVRDANALYNLYNKFGRGVISEEEFCHLYLTDRLSDWIVQTYKVERIEE